MTAACVISVNSYYTFPQEQKSVSFHSVNNDLKLFLSFVYNINMSVKEGVSSGLEITSVWLLNWLTVMVRWLIMPHNDTGFNVCDWSFALCVSVPVHYTLYFSKRAHRKKNLRLRWHKRSWRLYPDLAWSLKQKQKELGKSLNTLTCMCSVKMRICVNTWMFALLMLAAEWILCLHVGF